LKTQCSPESLPFHPLSGREVRGSFDGGAITSDAGGLLLREVEKRTGIIAQFAACFRDSRDPARIEHTVEVHRVDFQWVVAALSTVVALVAIGISYLVYGQKPMMTMTDPLERLGGVFKFLNGKWYVDELYHAIIIGPFEDISRFMAYAVDWDLWHDIFHDNILAGGFRWIANFMAWFVDKGIVDGFFDGLGGVVRDFADMFRRFQTGYVRHYALAVLFGVVVVLGVFLFTR